MVQYSIGIHIYFQVMGHNKSKMQGLLLPAQSGKTSKAIAVIKQRFETISQLQEKTDINIWISANNKLLVKQTETRMHNELCSSDDDSDDGNDSDAIIQGEVFSWISGSKKNNVSVDALTLQILKGKVEMIVMCSNAIRIRYLVQLLESLDEFGALFLKKVNIWIDEADQSIRLWSKYSRVLNMPMIQHVTLVSATMETIFKHPSIQGSLRVMKYPTTYPKCYRRLIDAECIEMDVGASNPSDYVLRVLTAHPKLIQPGMRAFIPGDVSKQSHEAISELLQGHGFAVIILNGTHKELRIPGEKTIDLSTYLTVDDDEKSDPIEFNTILSRMYVGNRLDRFPLAITGFICVERGITFQCAPDRTHNGFLFDYGIIPPIADKAEAYQAMARLFGNIGDFPTYKPCQIYSNSATFKKVRIQEEIAVNLARIMHESGREEATIADLKMASDVAVDINTYRIYDQEAHVREVCKILGHTYRSAKKNSDGFKGASFRVKAKAVSLYDAVKNVPKAQGSSSGGTESRRCYPCYVDTSDNTTLRFVVIIRPGEEDKMKECDAKFPSLRI